MTDHQLLVSSESRPLTVPEIQTVCRAVARFIDTGTVITTVPAQKTFDNRNCWGNVAKLVRKMGGTKLMGFSISKQEPRLPQKNPYADVVFNSHSVWQKGETVYETIREVIGSPFITCNIPQLRIYVEIFDPDVNVAKLDLPAWSWDFQPFFHWTGRRASRR